MTSHKLKRAMGATFMAAVMAATLGVTSSPALADPGTSASPKTASEAMQQYQKLSAQAEKLNQKYLAAQDDLKAKRAALDKANTALTTAQRTEQQAKSAEGKFRKQVDQFADASFQGARFTQLSALLTGKSPQDFLNRASALRVLATSKYNALHSLATVTKQADDAQQAAATAKKQAADATDAANQLVVDLRNKKAALQSQIDQVRAAQQRLSSSEQASLRDTGAGGNYLAPAGTAGDAMRAALSQLGTPYQWGGETPGVGFDCSGLTQWAYRQAGVSLPRTSQAQQQVGVPVSRSQLKPGDLVFFGSPAYHVGIYVGNGNMVNAPTAGEVVRVQPLESTFSGGRRVAG